MNIYPDDILQHVVYRAAMIATKAALSGRPLSAISWIPPSSATADPYGSFVTREFNGSISDTKPWDK